MTFYFKAKTEKGVDSDCKAAATGETERGVDYFVVETNYKHVFSNMHTLDCSLVRFVCVSRCFSFKG